MSAALIHTTLLVVLLAFAGIASGENVPDEYVVDVAEAKQFCTPIRSYFADVTQTVQRVGGRTIRHQAGGGFGLPIKQKVGDKHLLHLGADVGWFQVGEAVFAVADGVVRLSEGPSPDRQKVKQTAGAMEWGNVIAIEHRPGKDEYITTVYGHLDSHRLVKVGDLVKAGQQIGAIGKKHLQINGGYDPHLHFGIRKGRKAAVGTVFTDVSVNGVKTRLHIGAVTATTLKLKSSDMLPDRLTIVAGQSEFVALRDGSVLKGPAKALWQFQPLGFRVAGYGLSADDWHDPTMFLREHNAAQNMHLLTPAVKR